MNAGVLGRFDGADPEASDRCGPSGQEWMHSHLLPDPGGFAHLAHASELIANSWMETERDAYKPAVFITELAPSGSAFLSLTRAATVCSKSRQSANKRTMVYSVAISFS